MQCTAHDGQAGPGQVGANNYGVLYKLSATGTIGLLHSSNGFDCAYPEAELVLTGKRTLFSTANYFGSDGFGTVWRYVP